MSCLKAAAKILAEKGEPMTCKEMIEAMAAKGYLTTPGGLTPRASLHSSIAREIRDKLGRDLANLKSLLQRRRF
jgi:hypothetical protein